MKKINKVIIWGHPLGSHTHSYIHAAFYKAFKSLGYDTYWGKEGDDFSNLDLENSLFLTEGQVDSGIPLIKDSYYVLHNCNSSKYLENECKILEIQTLQNHVKTIENINKIDNYTYLKDNMLYMCWGTDLLPDEIDLDKANNNKSGDFVWIGSKGGGDTTFENWSTIDPFMNKCINKGIKATIVDPWGRPVSFEDNMRMINEAYLAPAILGKWQVEMGYIPCRIFKNISYGHFGYTNSQAVFDVIGDPLVFSNNSEELFNLAIEKKNDIKHIEQLKYLMNEVKEKHTYINRIQKILEILL